MNHRAICSLGLRFKKLIPKEIKQMKEISITTEFIKLDQLMKFADMVQSGGEAKRLIAQELVLVNDEICTQRGKKLRSGDYIEFDGEICKVK